MPTLKLTEEDRSALYDAVYYAADDMYYDLQDAKGFYDPEEIDRKKDKLAHWERLLKAISASKETSNAKS